MNFGSFDNKMSGADLFSAAFDGREAEVKQLLKKGAAIEWRDQVGSAAATVICCVAVLIANYSAVG